MVSGADYPVVGVLWTTITWWCSIAWVRSRIPVFSHSFWRDVCGA